MNPVTVKGPKGTYTVRFLYRASFGGEHDVYVVTDLFGIEQRYQRTFRNGRKVWATRFYSRPMALRHAAELAGVERQRVSVCRPHLMSDDPRHGEYGDFADIADWWASREEQERLGDAAHATACARYQPWVVDHLRDEARAALHADGFGAPEAERITDALAPFFDAVSERAGVTA